MPLPATYATVAELQVYWRTLSDAEQTRATDLLRRSATRINELPGAADVDGDPAFSLATCNDVSLDMVKRAMIGGGGVVSDAQSMADMSATRRFVNPAGNLYLTQREINRLSGSGPQVFSLTPTSNARVPGNPWSVQPSSQTDE